MNHAFAIIGVIAAAVFVVGVILWRLDLIKIKVEKLK